MLQYLFITSIFLTCNFVQAKEVKIFKTGDEKKYFQIPGIGKVKRFPVEKFKKDKLVSNPDEGLSLYKGKKDRNIVKVIFGEKSELDGVFLVDSTGNTTASISKGLITEYGIQAGTFCEEVTSADLNGDGKKDYFVCIAGMGNGIAQTYDGILFLSEKNKYKPISFTTYKFESKYFVDLFDDGRCFLIIVNPVWSEKLILPPKDLKELKAILPKEQLAMINTEESPIVFSDLYFNVYYPVEIEGTDLTVANDVDKRFPIFNSWYKWGGKSSEGETRLLTAEQKKVLWNENKTMMNFPLRDKVFVLPGKN